MNKFNVLARDFSGNIGIQIEEAIKFYIVPVEYLIERKIPFDKYSLDDFSSDSLFAVCETEDKISLFPLDFYSI
jgi:hypothetical protein